MQRNQSINSQTDTPSQAQITSTSTIKPSNQTFKELLQEIDIDSTHFDDILFLAVRHHALDSVEMLISLGANIKKYSHLAYLAAWLGDLPMLKLLLNNGAKIDATLEGYSALDRAAQLGHLDVVQCLLTVGARVSRDPSLLLISDPQIQKLFGVNSHLEYFSHELMCTFCSFLDPISLYCFAATSVAFRGLGTLNLLWKPILEKQYPIKALSFQNVSQKEFSYYQIYRETVNESYKDLKLTKDDKMAFTLVQVNDFYAIKAWNVEFRLDSLDKDDINGISLIYYISELRLPDLNDHIFLQNYEQREKRKYPNEPLTAFGICLDQNNESFRQLLRNFDINSVHGLYSATKYNSLQSAKLLLELDANVNQAFDAHSHVLYLAAYSGYIDMVDLFLRKGAQVDLTWKTFTALYIAAHNGHVAVVERLLAAGANINVNPSPLIIAIQKRKKEVLICLLKHNADVTITIEENTLLHLCATHNFLDELRILLEHYKQNKIQHPHCYIDSLTIGYTPIYAACRQGHLEVVKTLVAYGARINRPSFRQATPLIIAAEKGHVKIVDFLLKHDADTNLCLENGFTPLHSVCKYQSIDTALPIITSLIRAGADPSAVCLAGRLPSAVAIDPQVKKIMLALEQISNLNTIDMISVEPHYVDSLEIMNAAILQFLESDAGKVNNELATICLNLLMKTSTPFGRAAILYAFLNLVMPDQNSIFSNNSINPFSACLIHSIGLESKTAAKNALHALIWKSLSDNVDLFKDLQELTIMPILKRLEKPKELPSNNFTQELLCLNVIEASIKKDLTLKKANERRWAFSQ